MSVLKYKDPVTGEVKIVGAPSLGGGSGDIPITSTPPDDVDVWIDPSEEHQEGIGSIPDIDGLLEEKADLIHAAQHKTGGSDALTAADIGALSAIESTEYPGCFYRMVDGVVEWVNPPMILGGEEYRTVERFNGSVVYAKLISLGKLVSGYAEYQHGIENIYHVVRVQAYRNLSPLPHFYGNSFTDVWTCYVAECTPSKISICSGASAANNGAQCLVHYVKN